MKRLRLIIVAVIVVAISIGGIALGVTGLRAAEYRDATFTRINADFFIIPDSGGVVADLKEQPFINQAVGLYNFPKFIESDKNSQKVSILFAEDMPTAYEVSMFNKDTLMSGELGGDGIYLDKTAADALGIKVGGKISYSFGTKTMQAEVQAIVLPCYIPLLDKGVALAKWTQAHKDQLSEEKNFAFIMIDAQDTAATHAYIKQQNYASTITVLSNVAQSIGETTAIYRARAVSGIIGLSIAAGVVFAAFCIATLMSDKKSNLSHISRGKKAQQIIKKDCLQYSIAALSIVVVAIVFGLIFAFTPFYFDSFATAILLPSLMPIAGLLVVLAFIMLYYKKLLEQAPTLAAAKNDGILADKNATANKAGDIADNKAIDTADKASDIAENKAIDTATNKDSTAANAISSQDNLTSGQADTKDTDTTTN